MKRIVLFAMGVLMAAVAQARHPQFTRLATPGDPTFDIVISCRENPEEDNDGKTRRL